MRDVLALCQRPQVNDEGVSGDCRVGAVETQRHIHCIDEEPEMYDALAALSLGGIEPKTRAGDNRLQGVDLREGARASRVRRDPIVHVGCRWDAFCKDPEQHFRGPRRTIVWCRPEPEGDHPVEERGQSEYSEVAAGGLCERKVVVVGRQE